jgi:hypothetical protein
LVTLKPAKRLPSMVSIMPLPTLPGAPLLTAITVAETALCQGTSTLPEVWANVTPSVESSKRWPLSTMIPGEQPAGSWLQFGDCDVEFV